MGISAYGDMFVKQKNFVPKMSAVGRAAALIAQKTAIAGGATMPNTGFTSGPGRASAADPDALSRLLAAKSTPRVSAADPDALSRLLAAKSTPGVAPAAGQTTRQADMFTDPARQARFAEAEAKAAALRGAPAPGPALAQGAGAAEPGFLSRQLRPKYAYTTPRPYAGGATINKVGRVAAKVAFNPLAVAADYGLSRGGEAATDAYVASQDVRGESTRQAEANLLVNDQMAPDAGHALADYRASKAGIASREMADTSALHWRPDMLGGSGNTAGHDASWAGKGARWIKENMGAGWLGAANFMTGGALGAAPEEQEDPKMAAARAAQHAREFPDTAPVTPPGAQILPSGAGLLARPPEEAPPVTAAPPQLRAGAAAAPPPPAVRQTGPRSFEYEGAAPSGRDQFIAQQADASMPTGPYQRGVFTSLAQGDDQKRSLAMRAANREDLRVYDARDAQLASAQNARDEIGVRRQDSASLDAYRKAEVANRTQALTDARELAVATAKAAAGPAYRDQARFEEELGKTRVKQVEDFVNRVALKKNPETGKPEMDEETQEGLREYFRSSANVWEETDANGNHLTPDQMEAKLAQHLTQYRGGEAPNERARNPGFLRRLSNAAGVTTPDLAVTGDQGFTDPHSVGLWEAATNKNLGIGDVLARTQVQRGMGGGGLFKSADSIGGTAEGLVENERRIALGRAQIAQAKAAAAKAAAKGKAAPAPALAQGGRQRFSTAPWNR